MRKTRIAIIAAIVLVLAGYLGSRWLRPHMSDSDQIRAQILRAAKAAQNRQVGTLMSVIAEDYNDGTYTRPDLMNLARAGLRPGRELQVAVFLQGLRVQGETATTEIGADIRVLPGGSQGRYRIVAYWRKGSKGWQVVRAHGWEGAQQLELGGGL